MISNMWLPMQHTFTRNRTYSALDRAENPLYKNIRTIKREQMVQGGARWDGDEVTNTTTPSNRQKNTWLGGYGSTYIDRLVKQFPFGIVSLADGTSEGHGHNMANFRLAQTASYGVLPGPAGSGMENTFVSRAEQRRW